MDQNVTQKLIESHLVSDFNLDKIKRIERNAQSFF